MTTKKQNQTANQSAAVAAFAQALAEARRPVAPARAAQSKASKSVEVDVPDGLATPSVLKAAATVAKSEAGPQRVAALAALDDETSFARAARAYCGQTAPIRRVAATAAALRKAYARAASEPFGGVDPDALMAFVDGVSE